MLEQLRQMFPNLIASTIQSKMDTDTYKWYVTNDNDIIGVPKSDLTDRETELLEILLTPYKASQPPTNEREKMWMDILFQQEHVTETLSEKISKFQFVYFSLSDETIDPESFREAIHGLFPEKTAILWENNYEGVIIQEDLDTENSVSYSEIIEVLTTDFYINIKLFVGPLLYHIQQAAAFYRLIKKCYHLTRRHNHDVLAFLEAIPHLFLHHITEQDQQLITDAILHDVKDDEELLKTVQVFLEANSNTTLAAKKMYMHRNSLQYRVDKFIEKTGIDVKQFSGAIAVYLCLLIRTK
ncbi:helix-turn-helix domain-containing protein [Gracilibacillus sp. S3-1-1]|uniref:Helix-turn-helix domain-containing protein n=1 Tax=Gracilibacillus pellucidus TaxID=3095368 RepID=A0ACC6M459_9BACI|nr:helix-turn-helix domain-containing protein [Gracilibacillus sp. S3-1-1]MDX8045694.1 helix-turn-helix domain-containing protein [Gracilibacillus sp. S3-1-1]